MSSDSPWTAGGAPADVEPHEAQRPVQQVARVGRVGPPRGDIHGDAGIGDCRLEPRGVAGTKGCGNRAIERVAGALRQPELRRGPTRAGRLVGPDQPRPEPGEIRLLDHRPLAKRDVERVLARPRDRLLESQPLEDAADKAVVAGSGGDGLGDDIDAAVVPREHAQVRCGGMEGDGQLRLVVARGPQVRPADGIRVLDQQPRLDIREQLLARGLARISPRREAWPVARAMSWRSSMEATGRRDDMPWRARRARRLVPRGRPSGTADNGR